MRRKWDVGCERRDGWFTGCKTVLWSVFRDAGDVIFLGEDVEKERCSVRDVFSGIYESILTEV